MPTLEEEPGGGWEGVAWGGHSGGRGGGGEVRGGETRKRRRLGRGRARGGRERPEEGRLGGGEAQGRGRPGWGRRPGSLDFGLDLRQSIRLPRVLVPSCLCGRTTARIILLPVTHGGVSKTQQQMCDPVAQSPAQEMPGRLRLHRAATQAMPPMLLCFRPHGASWPQAFAQVTPRRDRKGTAVTLRDLEVAVLLQLPVRGCDLSTVSPRPRG